MRENFLAGKKKKILYISNCFAMRFDLVWGTHGNNTAPVYTSLFYGRA
jgi:hypothetical protein